MKEFNTATRFVHGFQRYDKVLYRDVECFVFGRRTAGYFDLRELNGTKIHSSAKAKDCLLAETASTLLICSLKGGATELKAERISVPKIEGASAGGKQNTAVPTGRILPASDHSVDR